MMMLCVSLELSKRWQSRNRDSGVERYVVVSQRKDSKSLQDKMLIVLIYDKI